MKKLFALIALVFSLCCFSAVAFADSSPLPSIVSSLQADQSATSLDSSTLLGQILQVIQGFGGLSWVLKIACIVLLIIATMKVSFFAPIWNWLGSAQAYVAPLLGLIAGVLVMLGSGQSLTFPVLMAYLGSGAGAIILHELLDGLKAIPGLGTTYVSIINTVESLLGGGSTPPSA